MTAYDKVQLTRKKGRPTAKKFIENITADFYELHGDRLFADDCAIIGGVANIGGVNVTVIGIEKGEDTVDKLKRNFGSAHPEGYRKALRLMKQAEKFNRPVVCFVDTSGAYCGIGAEERGQGSAIATNLAEMSALKTPIITVMIGEGGSGGALALAVADEVWMLENAYYSVISPEGAASIMWKDASKVKEACDCLRLTAEDLLGFGVIEEIIAETDDMFETITRKITTKVAELSALPVDVLLERRYEKFRKIGR